MSSGVKPSVLFVAGWWPSEADPGDAPFVREHALAAEPFVALEVLVFRVQKKKLALPKVHVSESPFGTAARVFTYSIATPLRRFGIHGALVRKAFVSALKKAELRGKVDLVHINVRTPQTEAILSVCSERNIPVILTEHSSFYHRGIALLPPEVQASYRERIRNWLADPIIKRILPVSKDLGSILSDKWGTQSERTVVVPNVAGSEFTYKAKPDATTTNILLVARWQEPKDPMILLRILCKLSSEERAALNIVWVGTGDQMDEIKKFAEQNELAIHFHGHCTKHRVAEMMQQAHLFVHPTKAENLPCVIIESLCCGTPVLSMAVNGVPELVDNTNGILVPPQDEGALLFGLRAILRRIPEMDNAAIATNALAKYSPKAVGEHLFEIYSMVIKEHAGR